MKVGTRRAEFDRNIVEKVANGTTKTTNPGAKQQGYSLKVEDFVDCIPLDTNGIDVARAIAEALFAEQPDQRIVLFENGGNVLWESVPRVPHADAITLRKHLGRAIAIIREIFRERWR